MLHVTRFGIIKEHIYIKYSLTSNTLMEWELSSSMTRNKMSFQKYLIECFSMNIIIASATCTEVVLDYHKNVLVVKTTECHPKHTGSFVLLCLVEQDYISFIPIQGAGNLNICINTGHWCSSIQLWSDPKNQYNLCGYTCIHMTFVMRLECMVLRYISTIHTRTRKGLIHGESNHCPQPDVRRF